MDEDQLKKSGIAFMAEMQQFLGLHDWKFELNCTTDTGLSSMATVRPEPGYQVATIDINPGEVKNEKQLQADLFHEMLHVYNGDMETFRKACYQLIETESVRNSLDEVWRVASEHLVRRLERLFECGMGLSIDDLLGWQKRGSRLEDCDA